MPEDDVLGQDEIDALLGELGGEEEEGGGAEPELETAGVSETAPSPGSAAEPDDKYKNRKIKSYNFKRPDKFSKDQIRTMQMIHESFARTTTTDLSAQLRSLASLTVASVDQLSYEEFMKVVPNPTTLGILDMDPLDGKAIFEMDPTLVFQIVDRLFGGTGESQPENLDRELTDIEHSVIERIFMSILNNLREAWEGVIDLRPRLEQIESNPQFVQIIPPNDMVVLITFDTKIGNVQGMTNLCIPYVILGPVINKLSATFWYSSASHELSDEQLKKLRDKIDYIDVPISVEVGKSKLDTREVINLEVGDIIKLDTGLNEPFELIINGRPKYYCQPGQKGQSMAVQLLEPMEEEEFIAEMLNELKEDIFDEEFEGEAISHG